MDYLESGVVASDDDTYNNHHNSQKEIGIDRSVDPFFPIFGTLNLINLLKF